MSEYSDRVAAITDLHGEIAILRASNAALAASAARIEALEVALREIEAHLADHWNCGAVQLFLIASRALVTARAVLDAAPRSDGENYLPLGAAALDAARTIDDGEK